jgi:2,4-dienoyl-CoA reductase-like NADH-dependent reductase (Old Yellow Enzyme family)
MVITGNLHVDENHLGGPTDAALSSRLSDAEIVASWKTWATACKGENGTAVVVQINHPGRQSPMGAGDRGIFAKALAPSAVPLSLGSGFLPHLIRSFVFGTPRAMTVDEIHDVVARFARAARLAAESGFAGIEIHAAHGYLLAQFLSSRSNLRTDDYGGSPTARARIVVEIIHAIRAAVPKGFCVGIKLNSVDHQSKDELAECIEQMEEIRKAGVDFLEISGGTYEDPKVSYCLLRPI